MFAVYVVAALPIVLVGLGRHNWFFGDEWSFLAERDGARFTDLFRSHAEHWSTLPVLSYRVLFNLFALHSYVPYQAVVVVAHLVVAVLLRATMRRAGVGPWTATLAAALFVLFGPGQENIVWAFQIGFVGAVMFGLVQLLASDHPGALDRRDWFGLAAGAAGLMCSGVSLVMIVAVGLACLVRRGRRVAAFHTVPLAVLYAVWSLLSRPGGIENPYGRNATAGEVIRFTWSGVRGVFAALGGHTVVAAVFAAAFAVGFALIVPHLDREVAARLAGPLALLASAIVFLVGTGYTRWFVTPVADTQSRYIYTVAALLLPAFAVAVDAIVRRWSVAAPLFALLVVVAIVANVRDFGSAIPWSTRFQEAQKAWILAVAHSADARRVPADVRAGPWVSIGWLRTASTRGDLPAGPPLDRRTRAKVHLALGVGQLVPKLRSNRCGTVPTSGWIVDAPRGTHLGAHFDHPPAVGTVWFLANAVIVTSLDASGRPLATVAYKTSFGSTFEIDFNGMRVRFQSGTPTQHLVLCGAGLIPSRP